MCYCLPVHLTGPDLPPELKVSIWSLRDGRLPPEELQEAHNRHVPPEGPSSPLALVPSPGLPVSLEPETGAIRSYPLLPVPINCQAQ